MHEKFNIEINYIKNERIKRSLIIMLDLLPEYFFVVPASSTGKYHPSFSLNEGGLMRHTKAATRIAKELLDNECLNNFTSDEKDLILMSIILHDGLKHGKTKSEYTVFEHPIIMSEYLIENKDKLELNENELTLVSNCILTHMGPFTSNYKGEEILQKPKDKYQRFVHMCDYLSSKKFLDIKFENDNIEY